MKVLTKVSPMHQEQPVTRKLIKKTCRGLSIKKGERQEVVAMATAKTDLRVHGKVAKSQRGGNEANHRSRVIRIRVNSPAQKVMIKKARIPSSKVNRKHQIHRQESQILGSQIQVNQTLVNLI